MAGKLIIIPALGREKKETSTSQASLAFVLMSQYGNNNNELALQHGEFCTMRSFVAKGLFSCGLHENDIQGRTCDLSSWCN